MVVSGLARHGFSLIQPLFFKLSSPLLTNTLSVKRWDGGKDVGGSLFSPALACFPGSGHALGRNSVDIPYVLVGFPTPQHTRRPFPRHVARGDRSHLSGCLVFPSRGFAGGLAAAFLLVASSSKWGLR